MTTAAPAVDLKRLPLRALLAYAVRCARRVRPLFAVDHPEAAACARALETAIRLTEEFAAGRAPSAESVRRAEEAAAHVVTIAGQLTADPAAGYAANAAYGAICATRAAMDALTADDPDRAAGTVAQCAGIVAEAAGAADPAVERAARLDWEMLHRMRLGRFPELGEPVNATESGILGPLFSGQARRPKPADDEDCLPPPRREPPRPSAVPGPSSVPVLRSADGPRAALESEWTKLRGEQDALRGEREKLAAEQEVLRQERARLEEDQRQLRAERQALADRAASLEEELARAHGELDARRAELQAEREAFEADAREFEAACVQLATEREALDAARAELDAARIGPQEELARLEAERRQAQDVAGELQQVVLGLQAELDRLRADHERPKTERRAGRTDRPRRAPAGESALLPAAAPQPVAVPAATARPARPVAPLRLLLAPGAATSIQIAELLYELATLYRRLGGPGVRFVVRETRLQRLLPGVNRGSEAEPTQPLVQLEAIPETEPGADESDVNPALWEQFRACLLMTLSAEDGLTAHFAQAEPAATDHPARCAVAQAVRRADAALSRRHEAADSGAGLPIDAVNQHLQTIGRLLRQLERERGLLLELAPEGEPAQTPLPAEAPAAETAPRPRRRSRWFLFSVGAIPLLAAAAAALT